MQPSTITQKLSTFVSNTQTQNIPDETRKMLRLSFLDWMAVGIAGIPEPVSGILRDLAKDEDGAPIATVFGTDTKSPARMAALINGTTSHALDYDDTHFAHIGHPSVAVIPATLAVAEQVRAHGADLQAAALIGIETSIRVGMWLGRDHYQTGFHQTGTAGAFGAAAGAARLLGFDAAQTAATLGLVATRASGLKSQFGTMGKPYNAGLAASNGVEAALLVQRGFEPNPDGLHVDQGFGATHAGQGHLTALDGLGDVWVFDRISHKFHACCHGLHATLEALAAFPDLDPNQIDKIAITTHPRWMSVCNHILPTTGLGAKFSYGMVTAMTLLGYDTAALNSYTDVLCNDPAICALQGKVEVTALDDLSETQSIVRITLTDGRTIQQEHDLEAPMALSYRQEKVRTKASSLIGAARADAIWTHLAQDAAPQVLAQMMVR